MNNSPSAMTNTTSVSPLSDSFLAAASRIRVLPSKLDNLVHDNATQTCPIVTLEQSVLHLLYLGADLFLLIIPKQDIRH